MLAHYISMADDSLATPVSKLPSVSTRDQPKMSGGGDVSYADILKQQEMERHQFDDQQKQYPPAQPQFQSAPEPMRPDPMFQQPEPLQQDLGYSQNYMQPMTAPYPNYMPPPPVPSEPVAPAQPTKWWKIWILQNKTGWIVAAVFFLLLTFVYPKVRGMQRFAGLPLPHWATAAMSVAGAGLVTAVDVSL